MRGFINKLGSYNEYEILVELTTRVGWKKVVERKSLEKANANIRRRLCELN